MCYSTSKSPPGVSTIGFVSEALDRYVRSNRWTREGEAPAWYPSNLGKCERQSVLKRAGVGGTPLDERTLRIFWMGDEVHNALKKAVERALPENVSLVGHELPVRDEEYQIRGRLDTAIFDHDTNDLEVIDYKSIRSDGFKPDLPKKEHVLQVGIYGTFWAVLHEDDSGVHLTYPSRGRICYWSKDDARTAEYVFPITSELRNEVRANIARLTELFLRYKEQGVLPDPLPMVPILEDGQPVYYVRGPKKGTQKMKEDWQMRYCPYRGSGVCCADIHGLN